jgi:hypothetical protein
MAYDDDFEDEEPTELEMSPEPPVELPRGSITITLQLDKYLRGGTLEDLIANNLSKQISSSLEKVIRARVEQTILDMAKGEFEKHTQQMVQKYFEKDFYKTNNYGQKTGEKISLVEYFGNLYQEYLAKKVDTKGNESSYNEGVPRVVYFMQKLAIEPLNEAIKQQVGQVAVKAKEQIQNSVSRYIADQLTPQMPTVPQLKS